MPNNKVSALIETLIEKTKDSSIVWSKCCNSSFDIKPLPQSSLDNDFKKTLSYTVELLSANSKYNILDSNNSYVSSFKNGMFFLLLYVSPIDGNELELRVQTENSPTSKIFASTNDNDIKVSSQLKRLYNIVDSENSTMGIDAFVNSFINDR